MDLAFDFYLLTELVVGLVDLKPVWLESIDKR